MRIQRLTEDKTRFINQLPWDSEEEKQDVLTFFKSHSNLESKITTWQSKDKDATVEAIRNLIDTTNKNKEERVNSEKYQGYRGSINWEKNNCLYLYEDNDWVYVAPLNHEGAVFCDSFECGGAGAEWCIGTKNDPSYWKEYVEDGNEFIMIMSKHPTDKMVDLKFMLQRNNDSEDVTVWNQEDEDEERPLTKTELKCYDMLKEYKYKEVLKICSDYFDSPEMGVFVAKSFESLDNVDIIKDYLVEFRLSDELREKVNALDGGRELMTLDKTFKGCKKLQYVDTIIFKNALYAYATFSGCTSLKTLDYSNFGKIIEADGMFHYCISLESIDCSYFQNLKRGNRMFTNCLSLRNIVNPSFKNLTEAQDMFGGCTELQGMDTSSFKKVTDAYSMFGRCRNLRSINLDDFPKVTNAKYMFQNCGKLTDVNITKQLNIKNAEGMFYGCSELKTLDARFFSSIKYATQMFDNCWNLETLISPSFPNVKFALYMFYRCKSLKSIDVSSFVEIPNAKYNDMFSSGCTSLTSYVPSGIDAIDKQLQKLVDTNRPFIESTAKKIYDSLIEESYPF